jgi:glycosyltransferase involved in cell wall biosynthesis
VGSSDEELVEAIVALLEDPERRLREGTRARAHVSERYHVDAWTSWARSLLSASMGG